MKNFLLGVVSTLLVLAVGSGLLLASLGSDVTPTAVPTRSTAGTLSANAPTDLKADETWLGSVDLTSKGLVSADGSLTDVKATGNGVRFGPKGLGAATLAVDATIPFATVAAQVGPSTRLYAAGRGRAGIERRATLFGRDLTIRAIGTVRSDGGQLVIEPETVDLGGPGFLNSLVSAAARALVTIRQPVPGVPDGLVLRTVSTSAAGFAVTLDGTDVTIGARGAARG